jgi:hypothetical protein
LRGIALGRRPLVVVLRGRHGCVCSEEVSNVQIAVYKRAARDFVIAEDVGSNEFPGGR